MIPTKLADLHLRPGDLMQGTYDELWILGDGLDLIPWGYTRWLEPDGQATIKSIAGCARVLRYAEGNHDPYDRLEKLFAPYSNVTVYKVIVRHNGIGMHGHLFAPNWRFYSRFVPACVDFMARGKLRRKVWYWYCRKKGWIK